MWDKAAAERYEKWYQSPRGSFALAREQRLLAHMVSAWPRRNHSLLEIGCGAGHFLELFYGQGFDVTGVDASQAMLDKARDRMGNRVTLRLAHAEMLPFDDDEFDFVALVTSLECMRDPEAVLREAFRVATKGVVLAYLNRWSVYRLEQKMADAVRWLTFKTAQIQAKNRGTAIQEPQQKTLLQQAKWFSIFEICRMIRKVSGKFPSVYRSTLFAPSFLWRGHRPFSLSWAQLIPLGAVSVVRVNLVPYSAISIALKTPAVTRPAQIHAGHLSHKEEVR